LHQNLIAELDPNPKAPLENYYVAIIAHLMWRRQNFDSFRIAEVASARYSAIASEKVPSQAVPYLLHLGDSDPADEKAGWEATKVQAQKELGEYELLVEMRKAATIPQMLEDFEALEQLDALIEKNLKRYWSLKAVKSLKSTSSPTLEGPKKIPS
jgi:hypothetical protein